MKNQFKGFILGVFVTLLLVGSAGTAMATVGTKAVNLEYSNIKVTLDGTPVKLVDANGNPVEPFIISGTTYLPVRAVAGAFGLDSPFDAPRLGSARPSSRRTLWHTNGGTAKCTRKSKELPVLHGVFL